MPESLRYHSQQRAVLNVIDSKHNLIPHSLQKSTNTARPRAGLDYCLSDGENLTSLIGHWLISSSCGCTYLFRVSMKKKIDMPVSCMLPVLRQ